MPFLLAIPAAEGTIALGTWLFYGSAVVAGVGAGYAVNKIRENADAEPVAKPDTQACATCKDPRCKELEKEMDELINQKKSDTGERGLRERFQDMIDDERGLPFDRTPGAPKPQYGTIKGHWQQIRQLQNKLTDKLHEWNEKQCGPPPNKAWDWATAQLPKQGELWKRP
jgi:hypothetical protein